MRHHESHGAQADVPGRRHLGFRRDGSVRTVEFTAAAGPPTGGGVHPPRPTAGPGHGQGEQR